MYCKNCGTELNENAVVCTKCGVLVGDGNKFCPNCGAEPDPLAVICVKCGYELKPLKSNGAIIHPYANFNDTANHDSDFVWAIKTCFAKYSTFSGRARRKEFWYWYLFTCLTSIVAFLLSCLLALIFPGANMGAAEIFVVLNGIWSLIILLPNLAVTVRRLHDAGYSGWNYFVAVVPIAGLAILIGMLCSDSALGPNRWGMNPKHN